MNQNFKKHLVASYTQAFEECAKTGHRVGDVDAFFNSIAMETFAKLIVQECIELAVPEDSYSDDWFKAKCDVMNRIKEHFGVEE